MNRKIFVVMLILFITSLGFASIGLSPESLSVSMYGGESYQIPVTIKCNTETDVVAYRYYTTSLEDSEGLTITGQNPFICIKNQEMQLPITINTVSNFKPETFDINFYVDANIQERDRIVTQIEYRGGGTNWVYVDKNVFIDRNVLIEVPKEIIKERIVEKIVEKPVERIVNVPVEIIKEVEVKVPAKGLFGLVSLTVGEITIVLLILVLAGVLGYFTLIKPKQGIENLKGGN